MGAPIPDAPPPGLLIEPAAPPIQAEAATVKTVTDDGAGNRTVVTASGSNRSWLGSLFASGDMSVDSLIVALGVSICAYWFLCGYMIIVEHSKEFGPLVLGGGCATILGAFAGGKTVRDRYSPAGGG